MKYNFLAVAAFTSLLSFEALAMPISGLDNTGADSVAGGQDLNYSLSYSGGDTTGFGTYGYEGTGWPTNGTWIANDSTSQWITPGAVAGTSFDSSVNGTYTWSLTFDLTGFDAASANFGGRWATDNAGTVSLNGSALSNDSTSFSQWSDFSSLGGNFNAGINTLEFSVLNYAQSSGNPTGLRVEFQNSDATAVTEPATLSLLGLGLLVLGFSRKKLNA